MHQLAKSEDGDFKPSAFAESFLEKLSSEEVAECPICFGEIENAMLIPECMHQLYVHRVDLRDLLGLTCFSCKECILGHIGICEERGQVPTCPSCATGQLQASKLIEVMRAKAGASSSSQSPKQSVVLRRNDFQSSTKIDALLQNLRECSSLWSLNCKSRCV